MPLPAALSPILPSLTPAARQILDASEASYRVLVVERCFDNSLLERLEAMAPADLLVRPVIDPVHAQCVRCGLMLWLDDLKVSHGLLQDIATPTGSLMHAILHRREGDFGNSHYWLARSRPHPALAAMSSAVTQVLRSSGVASFKKLAEREVAAGAFVDAVASAHRRRDPAEHAVLADAQIAEWAVLMDHTARAAMG